LMGVCLAPLARYQLGTPYDKYDKPLTISASMTPRPCCSSPTCESERYVHHARYASGRRFITSKVYRQVFLMRTCLDPPLMASESSLLFPVSLFEYSGLYLERTPKAATSIWLMSELLAPPDPGSPTSRLMPQVHPFRTYQRDAIRPTVDKHSTSEDYI
jgi:hypothetical protein